MPRKPGFLALLKGLFRRHDRGYELDDEDVDAFGTVVEVLERVDATSSQGRIDFRGSSWWATSPDGPIEAGQRARIIYRDNIVWIVEPYEGIVPTGQKDL